MWPFLVLTLVCSQAAPSQAGPEAATTPAPSPLPKPEPATPPKPSAAPTTPAQPAASPDAGVPARHRRRGHRVTDGGVGALPLPDAGVPHAAGGTTHPGAGAVAEPQGDERTEPMKVAREFFNDLLEGDPESAASLCTVPFQLESRRIGSQDELVQAWSQALRDKRTDLLTLYGIEILTPAEMEKRYGRPPPRLSGFPYREYRTWVAVANLSGHAAIISLRPTPRGYRVSGYTD